MTRNPKDRRQIEKLSRDFCHIGKRFQQEERPRLRLLRPIFVKNNNQIRLMDLINPKETTETEEKILTAFRLLAISDAVFL
jgi:hypothetical protein